MTETKWTATQFAAHDRKVNLLRARSEKLLRIIKRTDPGARKEKLVRELDAIQKRRNELLQIRRKRSTTGWV